VTETRLTLPQVLAVVGAEQDVVAFRPIYVDMVADLSGKARGDVLAGIMLSQIVYWHTPRRRGGGESRLTVQRDGHLWLVRGYDEWWDEIRFSFRQAEKAIGLLVGRGLVIKEIHKWDGAPKCFLRLDPEVFVSTYQRVVMGDQEPPPDSTGRGNGFHQEEKSTSPDGEVGSHQEGKSMDFTRRWSPSNRDRDRIPPPDGGGSGDGQLPGMDQHSPDQGETNPNLLGEHLDAIRAMGDTGNPTVSWRKKAGGCLKSLQRRYPVDQIRRGLERARSKRPEHKGWAVELWESFVLEAGSDPGTSGVHGQWGTGGEGEEVRAVTLG
jgi:hypothetical protein